MSAEVAAGTRVQVVFTLLVPAERAESIPAETAATPYVVRARGILVDPGRVGEPVAVRTASGRRLEGELEVVEPADRHSFGRPQPALVAVVEAIRKCTEELR